MVSDAFELCRGAVLSPRRTFDKTAADPARAVTPALGVLALYMAVSAVFYWLKPDSFPPPPEGALAPAVPRSLLFWVRVQLWTPALAAVLVATTGWFAVVLDGGKLPLRLATAVLASAVPALLLVVHSNGLIPKAAFIAALALLPALAFPAWRRIGRERWQCVTAVLLSANAPAIALVPVFTVTVLLRSAVLYQGLEMVLLFWTLGLCSYGVGRSLKLPTARAFAAVFLGFIAQIFFVFSMHNAGLLPNDVLKALMAV